MEKVITIAVAGYGLRGQCYSQYTLEHPDTMKVVAVADIVREKVDAAKQLFNLPEQMCFDSAEQMLEQPKLADLMFICTQDRQHVPMALAALEKGYHVLLEKPISPELSECIELQKKAHEKNTSALKFTTQQLVTCAVALALAYVTSYIKIFKLPFGGSVTLFSMLFIVLIGYWYGIKVGILTGLVYGIFQFLQEPYVLSFFQVCCDYILAFGAMGLSGLFTKSRKHGLLKAYILAILARGAFHALGGYLYWMDYMPDNFPKSLTALYPIIYNYSYILLEGVLTIVVISIPAVSSALGRIRIMATGGNRQSAATEK